MIDHIIISVSDLEASKAFYLKALASLGYKNSPEFTSGSTKTKGVGFGEEDFEFFIVQGPAHKPGLHPAFRVSTREKVEAFYNAAITAGSRDNDAPALSPEHHPDYFSAYVFDPDGHNIEAVCHEPA
jgi:catechol 2,3-dioxygenase-like lactoylglutathione lyase family enzyme